MRGTLAPPSTTETARDDDTPDLVARAQQGEVRAFEALYRRSSPMVHGLCARMVGERAAAEELTQDVFVRAWQKLGSFRGESGFSTWLHRIAVNVVLQHLRAEKRRTSRFSPTDDPDAYGRPAPRATPGKRVDLERAVEGLPAGARSVFLLHDVEGFRHEEIAALTGTAVGTSKAQLHRARKLLREALER